MRVRSRRRLALEGVEGLTLLGLALVTWPVSRVWFRDWGSTPEERERTWPGDVESPKKTATSRAIGIAAPAERVWPWIVQLGLGRGGFYSYELIERIGGIPVTNVESIEAAWQSLAVGDEITLHPNAPGLVVADLVPATRLCFNAGPGRTWSFYLEPGTGKGTGTDDDACRLLLRTCREASDQPGGMFKRFVGLAEEALDFVMEQRLLRTVKRLAEAE